jgi:hypothetical protein
MRLLFATLLIALSAGCPADVGRALSAEEEDGDRGDGNGGGSSTPAECSLDRDCVAAGARCCDCPTYAVPTLDPAAQACANVDCAPASCGSPMRAACDLGKCVLQCAPVACEMNVSCSSGFKTDANGCLTCECAGAVDATACDSDSQCARVRDDCCGCAQGGEDTAVPTDEVAAHEAALMCPSTPSCPGANTCAPDLAPRCVQGACELVSGPPPAGACGRPDLPACPEGEACTVNANDQATMHGVGICLP